MNSRTVFVTILTVLLGLSAGYYIDYIEGDQAKEKAVFDIDSEREWNNQSGLVWTQAESDFSEGKFQIGGYNVWRNHGYRSAASYRTRQINVTGENIELNNLTAYGRIGSQKGALNLQLYDCSGVIDQPSMRIAESRCSEDDLVYNSTLITEQGEATIQKDLSGVEAEGYLNIFAEVYENTTQPVTAENKTYWDSIKLNVEN